jgi:hypothetical protein
MMPVSIAGLAVLLVFYLIVLIVGVVAAKRFKTDGSETKEERFIVAGRNISTLVGIFTMTGNLTNFPSSLQISLFAHREHFFEHIATVMQNCMAGFKPAIWSKLKIYLHELKG